MMASFPRAAVVLLMVSGIAGAACEFVPPSNPFDPAVPPDRQQPSILRGAIVLDDDGESDERLARSLAEVVVTVLDPDGRPREAVDGGPLTLTLAIEGRRGVFASEIVPGTIRLDVAGVAPRFSPPVLPPVTLLAGATVDVGDLTWTYRSIDGTGPCSIDGQVLLDGGTGGARTVQIYERDDETGAQRLFRTVPTDATGAFTASGLPSGTYAIAADLPGFSPAYRFDIDVGDGPGEQLAQSFSGEAALTLYPVTAILLPQGPVASDGLLYTRSDDVAAAVLAFGGVTDMRLQAVPCTQPAPACTDHTFSDDEPFVQFSASATLPLPADQGRIGLFAQFQAKSAGGFVFTSPIFSAVVVHDTTAPVINSIALLGDAAIDEVVVTDDDVDFTLQASDDSGLSGISHLLSDTRPEAAALSLDVITTPSGASLLERRVGLPAADGRSTAWFVVEDRAGNRSEPVSVVIIKDTSNPTVELTLNGNDEYTTSSEVRASVRASSALGAAFIGMRFSPTLSFSGNTEAFANDRAGVTLPSPTVEGSKTLCVQVVDALGRTAEDCDEIVLDLAAPVGTLSVPTFVLASPFEVGIRSDDLNIAGAAVGEGIDCNTAGYSALASSTTEQRTVSLADTTNEGNRTVVACFKDAAGRTARVERTVMFDPDDPPLAQAVGPASGAVVGTRRPVFTWAAVAGAVRYSLLVRRLGDDTPVLTQDDLTTLSFAPTNDLPEEALAWIVVATKPSGRASPQTFAGAPTLTPDATAPTAASALTIAVDAPRSRLTAPAPCSASVPCINDNTPRLFFTVGLDAVDTNLIHTVQISTANDPTFAAPVFTLNRTDGTPFDVGAPLEDGSYRVRVRSTDDAGNMATSDVAEFLLDRTPPDAPSILPLPSPVSSALGGNIVVGWTPEGPSGAVAYRMQLTTETRTFAAPILNERLEGVLSTSRDVRPLLETGAHVVHQVRVASIDILGNQSAFAVASFANDTTPPCGSERALDIQGTDAANDFTNVSSVVVSVRCLSDPNDPFDGPAKFQLGCDGTAAGKPRVAFNGVASCVLPGGDGSKTVQAVVFDEAGNPTAAFADTIMLDRRAPTTPVLAIDSFVTNNPEFSFLIDESSIDGNLLRHEFMDGVVVTSFDDPRAVVTNGIIQLSMGVERTYTVRVRGVDRAGNVSPEAIATVTLDQTDPERPVIAGPPGLRYVDSDNFTFFLSYPARDPNLLGYELSTDSGQNFAPVPGDGMFTVPLVQDAAQVLAIRGIDAAGNVGIADSVIVVEDSRNPRPVALNALPEFTWGGAVQPLSSTTFTSRGAYVDVHLARTETNLSEVAFDPNFDHFEIRATHPTFASFVPLCLTPTALCGSVDGTGTRQPVVTTDAGDLVDGPAHLITFAGQVAGFRVPLVVGIPNAISVRAVDKAGNVSAETSVSTTESTRIEVTNDASQEVEFSLFGDRLVYISVTNTSRQLKLRLPGNDARFGTSDDTEQTLMPAPGRGGTISGATSVFGTWEQTVAQGAGIILGTFDSTGTTRLIGFHPPNPLGAGSLAFTQFLTDSGPYNADPNSSADEPSVWGTRMAFRQRIVGEDTDIFVREAGPDGVFDTPDDRGADGTVGTGDDPFVAPVNSAPSHQFAPQISGDHLAWLTCATAACIAPGEPRLFVAHVGTDRRFGTADDNVNEMTQAVGIARGARIRLYAPGTPGRPSCRNVLAYARDGAGTKGVYVIAAGADGIFDVDDPPVQVLNTKSVGSGGIRAFDLHDDVVVASDFFAPPFSEIVTAGPDGCLSRTEDNLAFDSGVLSTGERAVVHDQRVVLTRFSPTPDLVLLELGAERILWPRNDGASEFPNIEADDDLIPLGAGGVYNLATHNVENAYSAFFEEFDGSDRTIVHAPAGVFHPIGSGLLTQDLTVRQRGLNGVWDSNLDAVVISVNRPLVSDVYGSRAINPTFGIDVDTIVWSGQRLTDSLAVPVLRTAGADRRFGTGDDCEVDMSSDGANGYAALRSSGRRQTFMKCTDVGCGSLSGEIMVREASVDVCAPVVPVTIVPVGSSPDIDGPRLTYVAGGVVRLITGGADGELATLIDNTDVRLSRHVTTNSQAPRISGDRVVWIDDTYQAPRVMVADLADGSERVLARTIRGAETVSIDGDVITWGTPIPGETFRTDLTIAYLGLQPELPQDRRVPGTTRLRCPTDDAFEENDSAATATPLPSGASLSAVVCRDDDDHYEVDVPTSGCQVRADARFVVAEGDLDTYLRDPSGTLLGAGALTSGGERIVAAPTTPGTYDLEIRGREPDVENTYDIGVTVTCP